ncbi:integrase_H2C2 domain-containing protein [Trichonephila clavipes]|nr:integrase_H2C2 domain-containing protein [Trichonephila clavipes]
MLHEFRLINVRSENNETISFVYGAKSFRSHWNVGTVSTLLPKLLLQEIWKMKRAWDQELPQNIQGSYAGCVFARSIVDSRVSVILVRAKSRVAPLKLLSIPRLELMACCVGARLVNSILKALNMPDLKVTLWSIPQQHFGGLKNMEIGQFCS